MSKLLESFFTYYSGYLSTMESNIERLTIYKNPTRTEIIDFCPQGARGYISPQGDLYLEGYEPEDNTGDSQVIHQDFLEVLEARVSGTLRNTLKELLSQDWSEADAIKKAKELGVGVVLEDKEEWVFQLAESYDWNEVLDSEEIRGALDYIFSATKKKNREYIFRY